MKKALLRLTKRQSNYVDPEITLNAGSIFIEEKKQRNIERELINFNKELYELRRKFQELHDRIRQ